MAGPAKTSKRQPSDDVQKRLFGRWVRQKVILTRGIEVKDVVKDMQNGVLLINLMEVLTDKPCPKKYNKNPKMKPMAIDNLNIALDFCYGSGVEMKIKTCAEDIYDGQVKPVLALIWAIMQKFLKLGDEDEVMTPVEAIIMWAQSKVAGYNLEITDMISIDGTALCAIIHRHRPKLIPWDTLDKSNSQENFKIATEAAGKFFDLDQDLLSSEEFLTLNEQCLTIYIAEYFVGIAEARKLDLAAKSINKVVTFTKENDAMKSDYSERVVALKEKLEDVKKRLNDRHIDNTLKGAQDKIDDFYHYKQNEKSGLIGEQLGLEALYNQLALRLTQNNRPEFNPEGQNLKDVATDLEILEKTEQERTVALHAELNRQHKLLHIHNTHKEMYSRLADWMKVKEAYLDTREDITTVSQATLELRLLDAYDYEAKSLEEEMCKKWKSLGKTLEEEKYSEIDSVLASEKEMDEKFAALAEKSKLKRPVLDDHFQRCTFIEKVELKNSQHETAFATLKVWVEATTSYLNVKEDITSSAMASQELQILDSVLGEKETQTTSHVAPLKDLGVEIRSAEYKTEYSSYTFPTPDAVTEREKTIDDDWVVIDNKAAEKRALLEDHLARWQKIEKTRLMNTQHETKFTMILAYVAEKEQYLNTKEEINSVEEAKTALSLLASYEHEKKTTDETSCSTLRSLGQSIKDSKYETALSSWAFETPEEVDARHTQVADKWVVLSDLSAKKKAVLEDDLAREIFKNKVRMMNTQHENKFNALMSWIAEKETYLNKKEEIASVGEAETALSLLEVYEKDRVSVKDTDDVALKQLGEEILNAVYKTEHSEWSYEKKDEITQRHTDVDAKWTLLADLSAQKKLVLDDDLARELFKEKVRGMDRNHQASFDRIMAFASEKTEYLNVKEAINSVAEANAALSILDMFIADKKTMSETSVEPLKTLGQEINDSKYKTEYSEWAFETPEAVTERHTKVDAEWTAMDSLSEKKAAVLADDLAREQYKEKVRGLERQFVSNFEKFVAWFDEKKAYLEKKEEINSVADANHALSILDMFMTEKTNALTNRVQPHEALGDKISASTYETEHSTWKYETPEMISEKKGKVAECMSTLGDLATSKKAVLSEQLEKELEKERLRLEFAHESNDLVRACKDTIVEAASTSFGFNLEEVEKFNDVLTAEDARLTSDVEERLKKIQEINTKMTEMGVTENTYTSHTLETLENDKAEFQNALTSRKGRYDAELARLREDDELCRLFADKAAAFNTDLTDEKEAITRSKDELEAQLVNVEAKQGSVQEKQAPLKEIEELAEKMKARNISYNPHCAWTAKDCSVTLEQYSSFLDRKITMIKDEIEIVKLRGMTHEQLEEIKQMFSKFDADNSGAIDAKELKACMYALGEEKSRSEIQALISQHGSGETVSQAGFTEIMIPIMGVTVGKDDVIQAFKVINKMKDYAVPELCDIVLGEQDYEYIKATAPAKEDGHDYMAWTETVFAR
eukprot:GCRY01001677.1.p1 GENE.GCRY01001677.1~~GCRY01001677.1.p1  ORF type:complete len:1484 (+),score=524.59 GCRY01001677.1:146-4597(+)